MIYLYYPFDDGTGLDILYDLVRGVGNRMSPDSPSSPEIGELFCDNGTTPNGLWDVTDGDELYIIGHSYKGFKVIADHNKKTIDQTEIVNRLERCGLKKSANCRIILYACYSSRTLNDRSGVAGFVASSLKTKGFSCFNNVFGFRREVGMKAKKDVNGQYTLIVKSDGEYIPISTMEDWVVEKVRPHIDT